MGCFVLGSSCFKSLVASCFLKAIFVGCAIHFFCCFAWFGFCLKVRCKVLYLFFCLVCEFWCLGLEVFMCLFSISWRPGRLKKTGITRFVCRVVWCFFHKISKILVLECLDHRFWMNCDVVFVSEPPLSP